ncbi:MAG: hypothetical protein V1718_06310 [archaeon]
MKVTVVSHDSSAKKRIEKRLKDASLVLDKNSPDIVFVYGGDGSVLYSERLYPLIPKVAIRGSATSKTSFYTEDSLDGIIRRIRDNSYEQKHYSKITAEFQDKAYDALNEIQIHNKDPYIAVRFNVYVDGALRHGNVVGDGILVCTPFGSGAYYYSLGGEQFSEGLGLGFNNPHERIKSYVLKKDSVITIEITRGDALLIRDNDEKMIRLKPKDKVSIKESKDTARFLRFPGLDRRCLQ